MALVNKFLTKNDTQTYPFQSCPNQTVIDYITVGWERLGKAKDCIAILEESVATKHRLLVLDLIIDKKKQRRGNKSVGGS